MNYRARKAKAHKEKCRRGGIKSGEVRRAKMLARPAPSRPREEGELLGVLEWRGKDDQVRRWIARQGPRRNNIRIKLGAREVVCGWDRLLTALRQHLAPITRQVS